MSLTIYASRNFDCLGFSKALNTHEIRDIDLKISRRSLTVILPPEGREGEQLINLLGSFHGARLTMTPDTKMVVWFLDDNAPLDGSIYRRRAGLNIIDLRS